MPDIRRLSYRTIAPCSPEQEDVIPLLCRCFPNHWGKRPPGTPFPYNGISFIAEDGSRKVGHAAVMRFEISIRGRVYTVGGIASVGVDPEYRKQGIAERLCCNIFDYCRENGYAMVTLITGVGRVYEKAGWLYYKNALPFRTITGELPFCGVDIKLADELSAIDRAHIIRCQTGGVDFSGKFRRYEGPKVKHSWSSILGRGNLIFALSENGYAIADKKGVLEDLNAPATEKQALLGAILSACSSKVINAIAPEQLTEDEAVKMGLKISSENAFDPMDGEYPMYRITDTEKFADVREAMEKQEIFFTVLDKF